MARALRIGNCSGFYGDRLRGDARDARGRRAGRSHRGLPGRADDAPAVAHPVEGPVARVCRELRSPARGLPRAGVGARRADRRERRRAEPRRLRPGGARGRDATSDCGCRSPTSRGTTCCHAATSWNAAGCVLPELDDHRERLPGRLGDRRRARRRRPGRDHRPGDRCGAGDRSGGVVARLGAATTGTRWPARWWPATCWSAAHRRPAATTRSSPRWPGLSTSGSRWPRSRPTARRSSPSTRAPAAWSASTPSPPSCSTRSGRPHYLNPDVVGRLRLDRADRPRRRPGTDRPRDRHSAAPDDEGLRQHPRRVPQLDDVPADRAGHRGQGRPGPPTAAPALDGDRPGRVGRCPGPSTTTPTPTTAQSPG